MNYVYILTKLGYITCKMLTALWFPTAKHEKKLGVK